MITIKLGSLIFFMMYSVTFAMAQYKGGTDNLIKDLVDVINLAKKNNLYLENSTSAFPPVVKFNVDSNKWILTSWRLVTRRRAIVGILMDVQPRGV